MTATSTEQKTMSTIMQRALAASVHAAEAFHAEGGWIVSEGERATIADALAAFAESERRRERERCAGVTKARVVHLMDKQSSEYWRGAHNEAQLIDEQLRSLPDEDGATEVRMDNGSTVVVTEPPEAERVRGTPAAAPQEESMGDEIEKRAREFCAEAWKDDGLMDHLDFIVKTVTACARSEAARARREALQEAEAVARLEAGYCQREQDDEETTADESDGWICRRVGALLIADAIRALSDSTAAPAAEPGPAAAPSCSTCGATSRDDPRGQFCSNGFHGPLYVSVEWGNAMEKRIAEVERYIDERAAKPPSTYASVTDKEGTTRVLIDDDPLPASDDLTKPCPCPRHDAPADSGKTGGEIGRLLALLNRHGRGGFNHEDTIRWAAAVEALQAENAELLALNTERLRTIEMHRRIRKENHDELSMLRSRVALLEGEIKASAPPAPEPLPEKLLHALRLRAESSHGDEVYLLMEATRSEWRALLARVEKNQ